MNNKMNLVTYLPILVFSNREVRDMDDPSNNTDFQVLDPLSPQPLLNETHPNYAESFDIDESIYNYFKRTFKDKLHKGMKYTNLPGDKGIVFREVLDDGQKDYMVHARDYIVLLPEQDAQDLSSIEGLWDAICELDNW